MKTFHEIGINLAHEFVKLPPSEQRKTLAAIINGAAIWEDTPEGHKFWQGHAERLDPDGRYWDVELTKTVSDLLEPLKPNDLSEVIAAIVMVGVNWDASPEGKAFWANTFVAIGEGIPAGKIAPDAYRNASEKFVAEAEEKVLAYHLSGRAAQRPECGKDPAPEAEFVA